MTLLSDILLLMVGFFLGLAVACMFAAASRADECAKCKLATVLLCKAQNTKDIDVNA